VGVGLCQIRSPAPAQQFVSSDGGAAACLQPPHYSTVTVTGDGLLLLCSLVGSSSEEDTRRHRNKAPESSFGHCTLLTVTARIRRRPSCNRTLARWRAGRRRRLKLSEVSQRRAWLRRTSRMLRGWCVWGMVGNLDRIASLVRRRWLAAGVLGIERERKHTVSWCPCRQEMVS
jgi:hypothetical protein